MKLSIFDFDTGDRLWSGDVPQAPILGDTVALRVDEGDPLTVVKVVTDARWEYGPGDARHVATRAIVLADGTEADNW